MVATLLRVAGVTAGLAKSNGSLPPGNGYMTHVTCRLTAMNRDQLRNPTFIYESWGGRGQISGGEMSFTPLQPSAF